MVSLGRRGQGDAAKALWPVQHTLRFGPGDAATRQSIEQRSRSSNDRQARQFRAATQKAMQRENRSQISPRRLRGPPKTNENRSWDVLRTSGGGQERPKGASGASRKRLGASLVPPWHVRGTLGKPPGTHQNAQTRVLERPGACRDSQNRCQVASGVEKRESFYAVLVHEPSSGRFFGEKCRLSALLRRVRTLRSTAPAGKNKGSAHRAARRAARMTLLRKTMKIDPQIDPKSIEVGRLAYVEAPNTMEVGRSE